SSHPWSRVTSKSPTRSGSICNMCELVGTQQNPAPSPEGPQHATLLFPGSRWTASCKHAAARQVYVAGRAAMEPGGPPEVGPPGVARPPLPWLVHAAGPAEPGEHPLVPLAKDEQDKHGKEFASVEVGLAFAKALEPEAAARSLSEALALFPECAGRFVRAEVRRVRL
ncbi:unnamed protein product, partial [Prorocentrum cordatum]